ncbi:hypothetical protein CFII64_11796 [Pseudomonas sp. CFII64]|nr:hypothetical protein CFII64_11796 [Pseudomonas sp. CFII64]
MAAPEQAADYTFIRNSKFPLEPGLPANQVPR